jgi:hypothetical protein
MTSLGSIAERAIKHICLVGNRDATVQANDGILILRNGRLAAKDDSHASWFGTRVDARLTMRTDERRGIT